MQRYFSMLNRLLLTENVAKRRFTGQEGLSKEKVVEFTVYMRKEGRITVPSEVRAALDIEEGNLVRCKVEKLRAK